MNSSISFASETTRQIEGESDADFYGLNDTYTSGPMGDSFNFNTEGVGA